MTIKPKGYEYGVYQAKLLDDDGNTEVIVWHVPHEAPEGMFRILRWNEKKFTEIKKSKYNIDLVWTDAPKGKTLKGTSSSSKRKK